MATQRFRGMVDVLNTEGVVAAKAYCELVIDALGLGLDEWEGVLRDVSPAGALVESGQYRLRLPTASEGEVVSRSSVCAGTRYMARMIFQ